MKHILLTLALVFGAVITPVGTAQADTLVWKVRSKYPYKVYIKFFSQNRNHAWPGFERAWVLRDNRH